MTVGSSMLAITRSFPPHCRQVSMSMANTRLRRCAHDIARCRSVAAALPRSVAATACVLGTIFAPSGLRRREHAVIPGQVRDEQQRGPVQAPTTRSAHHEETAARFGSQGRNQGSVNRRSSFLCWFGSKHFFEQQLQISTVFDVRSLGHQSAISMEQEILRNFATETEPLVDLLKLHLCIYSLPSPTNFFPVPLYQSSISRSIEIEHNNLKVMICTILIVSCLNGGHGCDATGTICGPEDHQDDRIVILR